MKIIAIYKEFFLNKFMNIAMRNNYVKLCNKKISVLYRDLYCGI